MDEQEKRKQEIKRKRHEAGVYSHEKQSKRGSRNVARSRAQKAGLKEHLQLPTIPPSSRAQMVA